MPEPHDSPSAPAPSGHDSMDDVIAIYKRDVDRSLLRANLAKTPEQRFRDLMQIQAAAEELRRAGAVARRQGAARREDEAR
ncbi:MAG: hypothetical protein KGQ61_06000 [Planctomycetes bacterium]|nr:hypothetical protein [Planctomycetota bacterium]